MGTRRSSPDPGLGAMVQLAGRNRRRRLDLGMVGEALPRKGIPPKDPPPSFDEIEPAGTFGGWFDVHSGMGGQPLLDGTTGMAGKVVGDQVEVAGRVVLIQRIEERLEASGVAGGGGLGEALTVSNA